MSERETNEEGFCPECKSPSHAGHMPDCPKNNTQADKGEAANGKEMKGEIEIFEEKGYETDVGNLHIGIGYGESAQGEIMKITEFSIKKDHSWDDKDTQTCESILAEIGCEYQEYDGSGDGYDVQIYKIKPEALDNRIVLEKIKKLFGFKRDEEEGYKINDFFTGYNKADQPTGRDYSDAKKEESGILKNALKNVRERLKNIK